MAFEPNSTIYLLNVPWENDYKNVMYWSSLSQQEEIMLSKKIHTFTEFTYQRKDNVIRIPAHIDTLYNCNYVMYKNKNHSKKWFYAFITKMEYANDNCTIISIETDVYNTWWKEITIKPSFVEREHCKKDDMTNFIPEGLETGEYICNNNMKYFDNITLNTKMVMAVTEHFIGSVGSDDIDENDFCIAEGGIYGGVYSGLGYLPYSSADSLTQVISAYGKGGKSDAIQSIFIAPDFLCQTDETNAIEKSDTSRHYNILSLGSRPTKLNNITPRNKKLLTYPYCFLLLTNGQGGSAIYRNEFFDMDTGNSGSIREFEVHGSLTPGCSIRAIPKKYKMIETNLDEGLSLGKFPICNWTSDVYTNWLTQNSINIQGQGLSGVINTGVGVVSALFGNVQGLSQAANGLNQTMSIVGEVEKHKIIPDQAHGNINCGDVNYGAKWNQFRWYEMCIQPEYVEIIDDYFDKYGYKTNRVKIPNKNHRNHWWFTKTIACNIDGAIPQDDLYRFRKIYDDGVTFWKDVSNIENYSLDNTVE